MADNILLMIVARFLQLLKVSPPFYILRSELFNLYIFIYTIVLVDFGQKTNFAAIFDPIEQLSVPLNHAVKTVKHLSTVKKKTFTDAYEGVRKHWTFQ